MNKTLKIDTVIQLPEPLLVKDAPTGSVIKFESGAVGLVCWGCVTMLTNSDGTPALDTINKTELSEYKKCLGTLAGITVQKD